MEYGLIGETLGHSFSPTIHTTLRNMIYELHPLSRDEFAHFMEEKDFKGINVTIPYKEDVIPYLDVIDRKAKAIGAVNTIVNRDGQLYGYNTDYDGICYLLTTHHIDVKDKTIAILGTGGTCKTSTAVVTDLGAKTIYTVSRHANDTTISYEELHHKRDEIQVIINTTPIGMYPHNLGQLVEPSDFKHLEAVVDVIFNPLHTCLVSQAKWQGINYCGGLEMLCAQALYANQYFYSDTLDDKLIHTCYQNLLAQKLNIVLIGMPSCGKSTIGKKIAETLGMSFYDIDELIVERANQPIADIFAQHGEDHFRDIESMICEELAKLSHSVISCGGGVIKRKNNMLQLSGNSLVIFIDRPLDLLQSTDDRPLGNSQDKLKRLYDERYAIYQHYADKQITNQTTIEDVIDRIERYYNEIISH